MVPGVRKLSFPNKSTVLEGYISTILLKHNHDPYLIYSILTRSHHLDGHDLLKVYVNCRTFKGFALIVKVRTLWIVDDYFESIPFFFFSNVYSSELKREIRDQKNDI